MSEWTRNSSKNFPELPFRCLTVGGGGFRSGGGGNGEHDNKDPSVKCVFLVSTLPIAQNPN